jgi:hypothetical protein
MKNSSVIVLYFLNVIHCTICSMCWFTNMYQTHLLSIHHLICNSLRIITLLALCSLYKYKKQLFYVTGMTKKTPK